MEKNNNVMLCRGKYCGEKKKTCERCFLHKEFMSGNSECGGWYLIEDESLKDHCPAYKEIKK